MDTFSDHRNILESDVNTVVVAIPVSTHHRLAMEVLRAGKLLLVERLLATVNAAQVNLGLLQPDTKVVWDLAPHNVLILLAIRNLDPIRVSAGGKTYIRREPIEVVYLTLSFPREILANFRLA